MRFLPNLQFDLLSFITGAVSGALAAWLGARLRGFIASYRTDENGTGRSQRRARQNLELRLRNEVLRHSQHLHLAASLFSLDEILIPPQLLLPPPQFDPEELSTGLEFNSPSTFDLPDWPELAAAFGGKRISLIEALRGGSNLIVTGHPGSGKTVALAHLASQLARGVGESESLDGRLPLLVHAGDLSLPSGEGKSPLQILADALAVTAPSLSTARLLPLLERLLPQKRTLLILDDMDELPPREFEAVVDYLESLLEEYPDLQVVTAAQPDYYPGLVQLGFAPLSITPWEDTQRLSLIQKWGEIWRSAFSAQENASLKVDNDILDGWLQQEISTLTPLELTLRIWAVRSGDGLGSKTSDDIEAYIRRMVGNQQEERSKLEALALKLVLAEKHNMLEAPESSMPVAEEMSRVEALEKPTPVSVNKLPSWFDSRLIARQAGGGYRFPHPVIAGYLAACNAARPPKEAFVRQAHWASKEAWLRFSAQGQDSAWVQSYLEQSTPPLQKNLLKAARWISAASPNTWHNSALRWLTVLAQNENAPAGLRFRAMAALALSGSSGLSILFQGCLKSSDAILRQIGAAGVGLIREEKLVGDLASLLQDPSVPVRQTAAIALMRVGGREAVDSVAYALLQGDEHTRRAAAEALAVDPVEGHQLLKEGSELEDLLVRRAVIYGLRRIRQPWSVERLQKMQVEDAEWVVKNTATQALDDIAQEDRLLPQPPLELSETPWLIAFAGRHGFGIAPDRPAYNVLLKALKEGKSDEKLAALATLRQHGNASALEPVQELISSDSQPLRAAAFETLWHLSTQGFEL